MSSSKGEFEAGGGGRGKMGIRGRANGFADGVPGRGAWRGRSGFGLGSNVDMKGFEKGFAFRQGAFVFAEGMFGF
jgi:hypothetical protein